MHYSTQPFLAWALNHYFYNRTHFVWAATPFYPYKQDNPKSSNPYLMYADLYMPWKDDDPFDRFITSLRMSLRTGVLAAAPTLDPGIADVLKDVCDRAEVSLFYPVVYCLDIRSLDPLRLDSSSGSAAVGSQEVLVRDLQEAEFEILFGTDHGDAVIERLAAGHHSSSAALAMLQSRCK